MAADTDDLAYFKRGEPLPEVAGKVDTGGLDYFRRAEPFEAILAPSLAIDNINVSDSATTSESVSLLVTSFINKSDSTTVSENVVVQLSAGTNLTISVSDTVTLTESLNLAIIFSIDREPAVYQDGPGVRIV